MSSLLDHITSNEKFGYVARIVLTTMFWMSGFEKLVNFNGGIAMMSHFGLEPAWLFNLATVIIHLGASALIIINRYVWLGAGALAVFTALTIPIVHTFWTMEGPQAAAEFRTVMSHISIIGAMLVVTWKSKT